MSSVPASSRRAGLRRGDYALLRRFSPPMIGRLVEPSSNDTWLVDAGFGGMASVISVRDDEMELVDVRVVLQDRSGVDV